MKCKTALNRFCHIDHQNVTFHIATNTVFGSASFDLMAKERASRDIDKRTINLICQMGFGNTNKVPFVGLHAIILIKFMVI